MVLLSSKDDMSENLSNPVAKLAKSSLTMVCEIAGNIHEGSLHSIGYFAILMWDLPLPIALTNETLSFNFGL